MMQPSEISLIASGLLGGLTSGSLMAAVAGFLLKGRTARIEASVKQQFSEVLADSQSRRAWNEKSIEVVLGPVYINLDRSSRAFARWKEQNLFLEAQVIGESNKVIRDILLTYPHFIPPKLLNEAGLLIEHYDRWLEEFDRKRGKESPELSTTFIFVGPMGFPFPKAAERGFREAFEELWQELYGNPHPAGVTDLSKQP